MPATSVLHLPSFSVLIVIQFWKLFSLCILVLLSMYPQVGLSQSDIQLLHPKVHFVKRGHICFYFMSSRSLNHGGDGESTLVVT